jgi:hypothetical protein
VVQLGAVNVLEGHVGVAVRVEVDLDEGLKPALKHFFISIFFSSFSFFGSCVFLFCFFFIIWYFFIFVSFFFYWQQGWQ